MRIESALLLVLPLPVIAQDADEIAISEAIVADCKVQEICEAEFCRQTEDVRSILFTTQPSQEPEAVYWIVDPDRTYTYVPVADVDYEDFELDSWIDDDWTAPYSWTRRVIVRFKIEDEFDLALYSETYNPTSYQIEKMVCHERDPL